ncbi:MAG: murein biosynthesis integral membrane protein MurJ [Proteobacteria bacterium]|nr:murein biosynthesis integral membrane protein MurJ [Pseudomonadota bacterium]
MALYRAIFTLGGWTMASRVLGFMRDILIAGVLGAGLVADAFFVAFKFPNFFRRLFAEGAFNAAFVPLFADHLTKKGRVSAKVFAEQVAAVMVSFLAAFILLALLLMPWLMLLIAPGFREQPEKFQLAIELTRLTFPYLLFMALLALLGGMLNALERFAATAAAPILLNLILISTLFLIKEGVFSPPGHALGWGVCLAGIGQFLWIAFACHRAGLMIRLPWPRLTPGVKRLLVLMVPGIIGAGVVQINLVVDIILATLLTEGSVSWLYYADRVNQLPLGVVGVAVGVALLPMLSRQLGSGDVAAALDTQNRAIEFSLFLCIPAAGALVVLAEPIVTVLFQRGEFSQSDATATARALMAFAIGLPAFVLIKALVPGFFARQDTATPVKIAVVAMVVNVGLAVALMQVFAHAGLALATALTAWLNAFALAAVLVRRGHYRMDLKFKRRLPKTIFSAAIMVIGLWVGADILRNAFTSDALAGGETLRILLLVSLILGGLALFFGAAQLTGAMRLGDLRNALRRS